MYHGQAVPPTSTSASTSTSSSQAWPTYSSQTYSNSNSTSTSIYHYQPTGASHSSSTTTTTTSAAAAGSYTPPSTYNPGQSGESGGQEAFKFPLSDGFPNVSADELLVIEKEAHGTLPKAAASAKPPVFHNDTLTSLGFIEFNELFEVAFFTELVHNITYNLPGYDNVPNRDVSLKTLQIVLAQEELHVLNAQGALKANGRAPIQPCEYIFPVDNFHDAIALASTFTDVVLGTLPDIQTDAANATDIGLIRGVGAVIGQEGEQNGFYRSLLGNNPSALPFLTASTRDIAFSAINQNFVVPGTCDAAITTLSPPLKIFDVLELLTPPNAAADQWLTFAYKTQQSGAQTPQLDAQQNFLTYINQQNAPVSVPITGEQVQADGSIKFSANFPGATNEMNGLTIALITAGNGFTGVADASKATLFGPALIELN